MRLWIGSANLTESAFSDNRELVCETIDDGAGVEVFNSYWSEFTAPDDSWLSDYASRSYFVPPNPNEVVPQLPAPEARPAASEDWSAYVARLRAKNPSRLDWIANQLAEVTTIGLRDW